MGGWLRLTPNQTQRLTLLGSLNPAAHPKLNASNDGMVRSVFVSDMLVGRNVVEIYVDGVRIDRRIFTR